MKPSYTATQSPLSYDPTSSVKPRASTSLVDRLATYFRTGTLLSFPCLLTLCILLILLLEDFNLRIYLLRRVWKDTRKASETANYPVSSIYSVKHNSSYLLLTAQKGFIAPVLYSTTTKTDYFRDQAIL